MPHAKQLSRIHMEKQDVLEVGVVQLTKSRTGEFVHHVIHAALNFPET